MWWDITYVLGQLALIAFFSVAILSCVILVGAVVLFIISLFIKG